MEKEKKHFISIGLAKFIHFFKLKWIKRLFITLVILFCAFWLVTLGVFYFYIQPNLDSYKVRTEQWFAKEMQAQLSIGKLESSWKGLSPELVARNIKIQDQSLGPALELGSVAAKPSWWSLFSLSPRFQYIDIEAPELSIVRQKDESWVVNGIDFGGGNKKSKPEISRFKLINLILSQDRVKINQAHIQYQDQFLGWSTLILSEGALLYEKYTYRNTLQFEGNLDNAQRHFILSASWDGNNAEEWRSWSGKADLNFVNSGKAGVTQYFNGFFKQADIEGNAQGNLIFSNAQIDDFKLNLDFKNIALTDGRNNRLFLPEVSAKAHIWLGQDGHYLFKVTDANLITNKGESLKNGQLEGEYKPGKKGFGKIKMNRMSLAALNPIFKLIGAHVHPIIQKLDIRGDIQNLDTSWEGDSLDPKKIKVKARFDRLNWRSFENIPGVANVSGAVDIDQGAGSVRLFGKDAVLDLATVYEKPILLNQFNADINLTVLDNGISLVIDKVQAENDDIKQIEAKGSFTHFFLNQPERPEDTLSLDIRAKEADVTVVKKFLPKFTKPVSKKWLTDAFLAGKMKDVSVQIEGEPKKFPFVAGKGGRFDAKVKMEDVDLHFAPNWPEIRKINGSVTFKNENIIVDGNSGTSEGMKLNNAKVTIHNLKDQDNMWMDVESNMDAPLAQLLSYTLKTPIVKWSQGMVGDIRGSGPSSINLKMRMPLQHVRDAQVQANLKLNNNTIEFTKLTSIPKLTQASGVLTFTEYGVGAKAVKASAYGGSVVMDAHTNQKDKTTYFSVSGKLDTQKLLSQYWTDGPNLAEGSSNYQAKFSLKKGLQSLSLTSDLVGTKWLLPVTSVKGQPLNLTIKPVAHGGLLLDAKLGVQNRGILNIGGQGGLKNAFFVFGGSQLPVATKGINIQLYEKELNLETLTAVSQLGKGGRNTKSGYSSATLPVSFSIFSDNTLLADHSYGKTKLTGIFKAGQLLDIDFQSAMASGSVKYDLTMKDRLDIHLNSLYLSYKKDAASPLNIEGNEQNARKKSCFSIDGLPNMKIQIDQLYINKQDYGVLNFIGNKEFHAYKLNGLSLKHPNAEIKGDVQLVRNDSSCTQLEGNLVFKSSDFGAWLTKTDLSKQIQGGTAQVNLSLLFPSADEIKLANMQGKMDIQLKNGRFVNVKPGFGRILGIFDLGMLGKRLTLNFKDIFLPGLSFDSINATGGIQNGVLTTNDLNMNAAGITGQMKGRASLSDQKVDMRLSVSSNLTHGIARSLADSFSSASEETQEETINSEQPEKHLRKSSFLTKNFHIYGSWLDPSIERN